MILQTSIAQRLLQSVATWDCALTVALGAALIGFGWFDLRAYHAGQAEPPVTYTFAAPPGGMRVGPGLEFFRRQGDEYARLENFGALEYIGKHFLRHGLGPVSTLEIFVRSARAARLSFRWRNAVPDQGFTVACDGQSVEAMDNLPPGEIARAYPLALHAGRNLVTFTYRRYDHDGSRESADPRPIAGTFRTLDLFVE